jgi:hypothetical protein
MDDGAWLASLEFPVPGELPVARLEAVAARPLFVYRVERVLGATPAGPSSRSTAAAAGR